ncbi:hypothetical protein [uncultured Pseudokineococcus sp.]|uniref:hypothetical protein n=1 Tax=uncultured Pseudokineococcus sp. TaxID=1642928 RepID=UPI0026111110|nr:hypothetical protein [uncultured Pseudokineococcus sp.]
MSDDAPREAQATEDPLLSAPPTPAPLVGTWVVRGEVLGEDGEGVVADVAGRGTYRWLGPTVVHELDVEVGGRRRLALEVVEPFDAARGAFPTRAHDDEGGVRAGTAAVDPHGVWTFRDGDGATTVRPSEDGSAMTSERVRRTASGDVPAVRLTWRRLS